MHKDTLEQRLLMLKYILFSNIILMHYLYKNEHFVHLPTTQDCYWLVKPSRQITDKDFSAQGELKLIITLCLY